MKGFARGLALKKRHKTLIRKWPIAKLTISGFEDKPICF